MRAGFRSIVLTAALLGAHACASAAPPSDGAPRSAAPRRSREVISREELQENNFESVYDAVAALRSLWMQSRGAEQASRNRTPVLVYLDQTRLGDLETLKRISIRLVTSIRHLDGPDATARYGIGHGSGVIMVSTEAPGRTGRDSAVVTPP